MYTIMTLSCTCWIILFISANGTKYSMNSIQEEQYSVEKQATSVPAEDDDYWEPADSINELYKQLCSKKYREIAREQVE